VICQAALSYLTVMLQSRETGDVFQVRMVAFCISASDTSWEEKIGLVVVLGSTSRVYSTVRLSSVAHEPFHGARITLTPGSKWLDRYGIVTVRRHEPGHVIRKRSRLFTFNVLDC